MHLHRYGQKSSQASSEYAGTSMPIVYIVDDDPGIRQSLESVVAAEGWQPRSFNSAKAFLACPRFSAPSCLVSDVSPPEMDGLRLQELLADRTELPIIFTASRVDTSVTVQAMKCGASEFLTKPIVKDVLLRALRQALERSDEALRREREMRELRQGYASLSCRERQVMGLILCGLMNKQIGAELGISVITVKAHRGKVMRKMGARSLAGLVTMAALLGMLPLTNHPRPYAATLGPGSYLSSGRAVAATLVANTSI